MKHENPGTPLTEDEMKYIETLSAAKAALTPLPIFEISVTADPEEFALMQELGLPATLLSETNLPLDPEA